MSSREPFHDWPTVMSTLITGGDQLGDGEVRDDGAILPG